ncbi:MAG: outer membrane beta-barrel protein, partial [Candidatus Omnitrophota bacterium]
EWGRGIQAWDLLIKPFIQYVAQWEDNVFYDRKNKRADFINRLSSGVTAELPINGGQHLLSGGFVDDAEWYSRFGDQNHNDYAFNGALDLNFVPFSLNVEDLQRHTTDRADTEFTSLVVRDENTARALLEIPFAAFFIETEALNFNAAYRLPENRIFNHNDFTVFPRLGFDVAPSTQFLVEYGYENLDYPKQTERNGDANQAMLGLRGMLNERMVYQAWGGAQWRIYDDPIRPDYNGMVFRAALQYDLTDKSNIVLKFNRDPQESTFDDQSFYIRNKASILWRQQVAERIFALLDGSLSYNEYSRITTMDNETKTRRDYVWESAAGFEYTMPNDLVKVFGEYRYRARVCTFNTLGYGDNQLNVGVKTVF